MMLRRTQCRVSGRARGHGMHVNTHLLVHTARRSPEEQHSLLWVTDFPMFEFDEQEQR